MESISYVHPIEELPLNRDRNFTLEVYKSDAQPAAVGVNDIFRFKIWQTASTAPTLDLDSVPLPSATGTADAGADTITSAGHGLSNGQRVKLSTTGVLPGGLSSTVVYFVVNKTTDTFQLSLTSGGAAVNLTDTGSGTHTWRRIYSTITVVTCGVDGVTPAEITVELHRQEVDTLSAGEWYWEASVVMPDEDNRIFVFGRGTFDVTANATGDVGTT